jgi:peroxiredoxin
MANDLTGDFDVVAEFAIPAANRVIAAMHRVERMLHTMSVRVKDDSRPDRPFDPSIVASVDVFGDASVNHDVIPTGSWPPPTGVAGSHFGGLDHIVNGDLAGVLVEPIVPSRLQGRAQLQLSPPTISVTDASGKKVTLEMSLRARYFPDANTPRVAEFVRGKLHITAAVNQVASQVANVVAIDIKSASVGTNFIRDWSNTPISAEDLAGVNKLIRNSLRNSFLPTNATLPSNIAHVQFKTMRGARDALAVLLDMSGDAGNPATQTNVFLSGGDDFAFAAGVEYVLSEFEPTLEKIRTQTIPDVSFTIDGLIHTWHITYDFTINSVTLELRTGSFLLTIKGHAHTSSWPPNFDFTIKQTLTLQVVGSTAELVVGDLSVDTDSWVIDRFKGAFTSRAAAIRDRALTESNAQTTVRKALNADEKLGGLLDSLLKPQHPDPGPQPKGYSLAYTSVEIRPSGIVLHGTLAVTQWPAPHIEFERIPTTPSHGLHGGLHGILEGPTYSALRSWIPGGTIDRHEWSMVGDTQPRSADPNTFIYLDLQPGLVFEIEPSSPSEPPPPVLTEEPSPGIHTIPGYVPLCLTLRGTRLSASGPVTPQQITATVCGYSSFPILDVDVSTAGVSPMIALTQPGRGGLVEVTGHAAPATTVRGGGAPNLLVHFGGESSSDTLRVLTDALRESGRKDAPTAVLAVLGKEQLSNTRHVPGVVYAEENGGGWERVFDLKGARRPVTLILGPKRDVLWKHEGEVDARTLTETLRKSLVQTAPVRVGLLHSRVRIGHPPPNFLFEHAPEQELTLRKVAGRPVKIVFWKKSSEPSIDAVRSAQATSRDYANEAPVVLAVNDGDTAEVARAAAAANHLSATIVPDPDRKIAAAYGVNIWPTIVSIDASGSVSGVTYGQTGDRGDALGTQQSRSER